MSFFVTVRGKAGKGKPNCYYTCTTIVTNYPFLYMARSTLLHMLFLFCVDSPSVCFFCKVLCAFELICFLELLYTVCTHLFSFLFLSRLRIIIIMSVHAICIIKLEGGCIFLRPGTKTHLKSMSITLRACQLHFPKKGFFKINDMLNVTEKYSSMDGIWSHTTIIKKYF